MSMEVDHLVVAANTLEEGRAWCERVLGVTPQPGGRHALMGTHNLLLNISAPPAYPRCYLEIIAIDPEAPDPGRPRWFDLDQPAVRERLAQEGTALLHWVARVSSLDATLAIEGQRHDVPAAVGRTAYRIVQEALTNTARHACAGIANVRIEYRPDALAVQVDDDGKAAPDDAPVPGLGLLGMRERVTALGGRLVAQPGAEHGFTVRAELPVERAS